MNDEARHGKAFEDLMKSYFGKSFYPNGIENVSSCRAFISKTWLFGPRI